MKKILIATTALVATTGFAAADISLSGSGNFGAKYNDSWGDKLQAHYEVDLTVLMTGETDNGLGFGASFTITSGGASSISDGIVFIEGGFGKLAVGDVDNAIDAVVGGLADIGFDGEAQSGTLIDALTNALTARGASA